MKKIGILSDTHSFLLPQMFDFFKDVDEIWHAGDFGNIETVENLQKFKPLRGVSGNIDDAQLHRYFPMFNLFDIEDVKVLMTHIGGYPAHYPAHVKKLILTEKPNIFVAGHSHILKIIYDQQHQLLFINPGAAGISGFHQRITAVRFTVEGKKFSDMEIFETQKVMPENF